MAEYSRRDFLKITGLATAGAAGAWLAALGHRRLAHWPTYGPGQPASRSDLGGTAAADGWGRIDPRFVRPARFFRTISPEANCAACHSPLVPPRVGYCHTVHPAGMVQCGLCPRHCVIPDGARGHCGVRHNRAGQLYTLVYGSPCSMNIDPIEKKPFFHFLPTAAAFSIATAGCNLDCLYCQNWQISQAAPEDVRVTAAGPEEIARLASENDCAVVAYTYSEPIVALEYVIDTARAVRAAGLKNVVVTAGFIELEPLAALCQVVDAIKVDLKGFNEGFYRRVCNGELAPVLSAIQFIARQGVHLELVNLVVPTLNDATEDLRRLCDWVVTSVGPDVPLHFSRFSPNYRLLDLPPTPVERLDRAHDIARQAGCRFVYVGNVPGHPANHTYCPACGKVLIEREGFWVVAFEIVDGACRFCGEPIAGIWGPVRLANQVEPLSPPVGGPDS